MSFLIHLTYLVSTEKLCNSLLLLFVLEEDGTSADIFSGQVFAGKMNSAFQF